jgi:hypothetical protein
MLEEHGSTAKAQLDSPPQQQALAVLADAVAHSGTNQGYKLYKPVADMVAVVADIVADDSGVEVVA